ncbi:RNA polymerase sigma factor RpoE [Minicystis rosea]|nr:RNA polymerase sigma factor RpoE [Minicystis rosea]
MTAAVVNPFPVHPLPDSGIHARPRADMVDHAIGDAELVAAAQAGDRVAEETIYRRHVQYVAGLVLRLLRDRCETEDVVQDTFLTAFEQLRALRDGGALRGWLSQIGVNQVRRRLRRRRLRRLLGLDQPQDDVGMAELASPGQSPEVVAELGKLDRVLLKLPDEHRIAWVIRYIEGASLDEVALACGCSLATVKRWIASADSVVRLHVTLKEGGT